MCVCLCLCTCKSARVAVLTTSSKCKRERKRERVPAAVPNKTTKRARTVRESAIRVSIPISFRLAQTAESVVAVLRDKLFVLFFFFCVFLFSARCHSACSVAQFNSIFDFIRLSLSIQCRQRMLSRHSEREHLPRLSLCVISQCRRVRSREERAGAIEVYPVYN